MSAAIRAYLLAGHELMLETLRAALAGEAGIDCAGTSGSLRQALDELERLEVDVVVIEASDVETSLEEVRALAEAFPGLGILALGVAGARHAVHFLEAGASGYLLQRESWSKVRECLEGILAGRVRCGPQVAALVYRRIAELSRHQACAPAGAQAGSGEAACRARRELSRREAQVLRMLALGLANKEIARQLGIAISTAANHVQRILEKLDAHRRRDAVRRACRLGILEVPALPGSA